MTGKSTSTQSKCLFSIVAAGSAHRNGNWIAEMNDLFLPSSCGFLHRLYNHIVCKIAYKNLVLWIQIRLTGPKTRIELH